MSEHAVDPRFVERSRKPGLDLLRALAIVVVVIYHAGLFGFALPARVDRFGWIGVDLFFVLSGYLIGGQLLASLARESRLRFGRFYLRRALRILPAYFVILALYFCIPAWREYPQISPLWKFLLSVQNIGLRGGTAFSHAWSLAVEDQFYLVLPLLLFFLYRHRRATFLLPVVVVLAGLALRAYLAVSHPQIGGTGVSWRAFQLLIYYPTWTRLDPLVAGVVLAGIERHRPIWWRRLTNCAPWLWLPAFLVLAGALYLGEGDVLTITTCVWQFPLIALGMALLLVCAVSRRLPFHRLEIPGVAFLASIAYSVYLSHKLVIHFAISACQSRGLVLTSAPAWFLVELFIYSAGALLFFAVERPFLQLRRRLAP
ncbi:MAG: acyltransferase family protein [Chthoniobacterales bacterium]